MTLATALLQDDELKVVLTEGHTDFVGLEMK